MTTYTIYDYNADRIDGRGWSLADCGRHRLNDDGRDYEFRTNAEGETELWGCTRHGMPFTLFWSGPCPHGKPIVEWEGTQEERETHLLERAAQADWDDGFEVLTDEAWDRREAMLEEEK